MKEEYLDDIRTFREKGYSYYAIAKVLNTNYTAVRNYCISEQIFPAGELKPVNEGKMLKSCNCCGRIIESKSKRAGVKFCSSYCRNKYWKEQKLEEHFAERLFDTIVYPPKRIHQESNKSLAFRRRKSDELVRREAEK